MKIFISGSINKDAAKIKEDIDTLSKNIKKIQNILDKLPQAWQGNDATSFTKKYNQAISELGKYEDAFNDYYKYLSKVYDIFSALDESYSKKINTD